MTEKIIIVRRTEEEIRIFGGEVFIDIDGINVGTLGEVDFDCSLSIGRHKIKMYKTHSFGAHIGISEAEIDVRKNLPLIVKYSSPMHVNSPGNIRIREYKSNKDIEGIVAETDKTLSSDRIVNEGIKIKQKDQDTKHIVWVVIFSILFVVLMIMQDITIRNM